MNRPEPWSLVCLVPMLALLAGPVSAGQPKAAGVRLRSIGADPATGVARAVIVEEGALVHTALMLPEDRAGRIVGTGDAGAQVSRVLASVEEALREARTTLASLVRLHVYVASPDVTPQIDRLLAARFARAGATPAVTFVQTEMPQSGILVAMDAVAATAWTPNPRGVLRLVSPRLRRRTPRASHAAIQPAGAFVIVSGRAAPGDFEQAIRGTLAQLRDDLGTVGLGLEDVVQIKSFVGGVEGAQRLQEIVAESFLPLVPPQVVIAVRQGTEPAEIEIVATAPAVSDSSLDVEHLQPVMGRYSRVARVHRGNPVFVSGLRGESPDPAVQVDEMFAELQRVLKEAGSDRLHLVKATYYVSDKSADDRINAIRPTIYEPEHPPAASKLLVPGTGRDGKGSTFDMIAVTSAR
jgi:enamine deaminase RidA (YjgF/YER057c/UK114 family)